ncbi:hypothetical protein PR202_ga21773 [Eleusine coracana subsp. coracana]|uniref:Myotubularin phosphatase domain-containing protein n=1 Tax=Eleusine coracana subsp. coracana TaxID=191504 RepID=A0AAV5CZZ4_ELECO|nr:hypothetical protein PR202_ga21773 [Eleusine coracana subsp. coracana]
MDGSGSWDAIDWNQIEVRVPAPQLHSPPLALLPPFSPTPTHARTSARAHACAPSLLGQGMMGAGARNSTEALLPRADEPPPRPRACMARGSGASASVLRPRRPGRAVKESMDDFLLEDEEVIAQSQAKKCVIELGTIPLTTIERLNDVSLQDVKLQSPPRLSDKKHPRELIQVIGKFVLLLRSGAVLARSSQPLVGLMMNFRNNADEKLVCALSTNTTDTKGSPRKLYIIDARPRANALANGAKGGGSESSSNYPKSEVIFLGIQNIHTMRDSLSRLRDYVDAHGSISSNGTPSAVSAVGDRRNRGSTWGGGTLNSMTSFSSTLGEWLNHIQNILVGASWIAAQIAVESASVLVHCRPLWKKDWLAFGHPFAERMGVPTIAENVALGSQYELMRQPSLGNVNSSPGRNSFGQSGTSSNTSAQSQASNNSSPILLQAKDIAEWRAKDTKMKMESMKQDLQRERHANSKALAMAQSAQRENAAIRKAIESIGCTKLNFQRAKAKLDKHELLSYSIRRDTEASGRAQQDENADISVSISAIEDSLISETPGDHFCKTRPATNNLNDKMIIVSFDS